MFVTFLQVIVKLYPKLETVAGKLLEIFLLLCASYHEQEEEEGAVAMETNTELLEQTNWKQRGNRLVSTRQDAFPIFVHLVYMDAPVVDVDVLNKIVENVLHLQVKTTIIKYNVWE